VDQYDFCVSLLCDSRRMSIYPNSIKKRNDSIAAVKTNGTGRIKKTGKEGGGEREEGGGGVRG